MIEASKPAAVRAVQLLLCAAYFAALHWSYVAVECVEHDYYGFRFVPLSFGCQLWILTVALAPAFWLRTRLERPSDVALWVLYLAAYLPATFIPYHALEREWTSLTPFSAALCASMAALAYCSRWRPAKFRPLNLSPRLIHNLLAVATLLLTVVAVSVTGNASFDFSLENVYERRLDARETVQAGALAAYALATLSGAMAPLCILVGFERKSLGFVGLGVSALLILFSFSGAKADLVAPLYLLALYVLIRKRGKFFGPVIAACACALVVLSVLQVKVFGRQELALYVVSRGMHLPGLLTSYYLDFFSDHAQVCYADGFLRGVVSSPYAASIPRLIGEVYFWGPDTNANANFWASAFANLGYPGIAVTTLALGGLLYIIDSLAEAGDFVLIASVCGYFGIAWSNVPFETTLLSNGVLCCVVFFWLTSSSRRGLSLPATRPARIAAVAGLASIGGRGDVPSARPFRVGARKTPS